MAQHIKFLFSPSVEKAFSKDGKGYAIEKEAGDGKRKYLCGISSGPKVDGHGDRMSEECIRDFMEQIKSKDITLYVNHGRDYTRDIGILTHAEITPAGDWYTEYRLYDDGDNVPEQDKQEAMKVWLQANGLAPYKRARQFGFSIEGMIPEGGFEEGPNGKIIKKVDLDPGVSLVSKPAYTSSVATAIEKSFKVKKDALTDIINEREQVSDYYDARWKLESAFQEAADKIISADTSPEEKTQSLNELFDSLKEKLIPVMLSRPAETGGDASPAAVAKSMIAVCSGNLNILKKITKEVQNMEDGKTLLMEAISSLQMLLEAMSQNAPAEEIEAKKSAANAAVKKAEEAAKAEDAPMDEDAQKALAAMKQFIKKEEPKKPEDKPEVVAAKNLLAAKAKLTKKQQEEISEEIEAAEKILREDAKGIESETPEGNIDSNNPETNTNAIDELAKSTGLQKSMATLMKKQSEEILTLKSALGEILSGFGVVEKKGVAGTGGQDTILKSLQESIDKLATKTEKNDLPVNTNFIKKSASEFAEYLTKGR
jgi:hypothetical protein